jgi:hypothetical protein
MEGADKNQRHVTTAKLAGPPPCMRPRSTYQHTGHVPCATCHLPTRARAYTTLVLPCLALTPHSSLSILHFLNPHSLTFLLSPSLPLPLHSHPSTILTMDDTQSRSPISLRFCLLCDKPFTGGTLHLPFAVQYLLSLPSTRIILQPARLLLL